MRGREGQGIGPTFVIHPNDAGVIIFDTVPIVRKPIQTPQTAHPCRQVRGNGGENTISPPCRKPIAHEL